MERNWLIRTYHNQILGPVSKAKLLEFIQKGVLGATDEVASGNGYWFSLREKDLIDKYILGDIPQSFNPVSEAKSVCALRENRNKTTSINASPANQKLSIDIDEKEQLLPNAGDLEYPDMDRPTSDCDLPDITIVAGISQLQPAQKNSEKKSEGIQAATSEDPIQVLPDNTDLEYPDLDDKSAKVKEVPELKLEKKLLHERRPIVPPQPVPQEVRKVAKELESRNDNYLFGIVFVLIIILLGIFFYYKEILNKPFPI